MYIVFTVYKNENKISFRSYCTVHFIYCLQSQILGPFYLYFIYCLQKLELKWVFRSHHILILWVLSTITSFRSILLYIVFIIYKTEIWNKVSGHSVLFIVFIVQEHCFRMPLYCKCIYCLQTHKNRNEVSCYTTLYIVFIVYDLWFLVPLYCTLYLFSTNTRIKISYQLHCTVQCIHCLRTQIRCPTLMYIVLIVNEHENKNKASVTLHCTIYLLALITGSGSLLIVHCIDCLQTRE